MCITFYDNKMSDKNERKNINITHQHTMTLCALHTHTHADPSKSSGGAAAAVVSLNIWSLITHLPLLLTPLSSSQLRSYSKNMKLHFTPGKRKGVPSTTIDLEVMCAAGNYCPQSSLPRLQRWIKECVLSPLALSLALCHPPRAPTPPRQKDD